MGILIYIAILRISRLFSIKNHSLRTIGISLFLIVSILYGYVFSVIYNFIEIPKKTLTQFEFENYIIIVFVLITFVRGFFPVYAPIKDVITNNYPIRPIKKFLINITNEFIYPFYFGVILFWMTFSVMTSFEGFNLTIVTLSWVIISHLIKRLLQLIIEFQLKEKKIYFLYSMVFVSLILHIIVGYEIPPYFRPLISLFTGIVILSFNYKLGKNIKSLSTINLTQFKWIEGKCYVKILLRNKPLRTMLIVAVFMKILIIIYWNVFNISDNTNIYITEIYLSLILSPILLFTYIFNNIFGFSPALWLSLYKNGARIKSYVIEMFNILLIPLFIDAMLSTVFYLLTDNLNSSYLLFYICCSIILFALSVFCSFIFPKKIENVISIKGNTSHLASLISILSAVMLYYLGEYNTLLYIAATIVVAVGLYHITLKYFQNTGHKIFQTLFC